MARRSRCYRNGVKYLAELDPNSGLEIVKIPDEDGAELCVTVEAFRRFKGFDSLRASAEVEECLQEQLMDPEHPFPTLSKQEQRSRMRAVMQKLNTVLRRRVEAHEEDLLQTEIDEEDVL